MVDDNKMPHKDSINRFPLSDIKVVDLTQVVAGPFATMQLGDLGADVIKIEAVGRGDRSREVNPRPEYHDTVNRNKSSIELDLKSTGGQEVAKRLLSDADVFVQSMKPGRIETFGLDYSTIAEFNPSIIYCTITGFGTDSPYEEVPAWDFLIQAMSGIMGMTGQPDGPPLWSGMPSGDLSPAMYASQSILSALYARETGKIEGEYIEIPMLDCAISWLCSRAGYTFGTGDPFPRTGTYHPSVAPYGIFECEDEAIVIATGTDSLWRDLCTALDLDELVADERFDTMDKRVENRTALSEKLGSVLGTMSQDEVLEELRENGVPSGPINDTRSVWNDEHVKKRGLRATMERENLEDATVIDHPVRFSTISTPLETPPPTLGQDTEKILSSYGFSDEEIEALRQKDVIS